MVYQSNVNVGCLQTEEPLYCDIANLFLHIFFLKLLFECFLCDREHVCAAATVGQKKESHSKSCVYVWERGNALSHSADGKLLLLWLSPNLHILPSSILPFSLPLSHRLRSRRVGRGGEGESKREREGSSKLKRESVGEKKKKKKKKKPWSQAASSLRGSTSHPKIQRRNRAHLSLRKCLPVIGYLFLIQS